MQMKIPSRSDTDPNKNILQATSWQMFKGYRALELWNTFLLRSFAMMRILKNTTT